MAGGRKKGGGDLPEGFVPVDEADDPGLSGEGPGIDGPDDWSQPINLRLARKQRNDIGNAERLIQRHGAELLYIKDVGWAAWDSARWRVDLGESMAEKLAQKVAAAITEEAHAVREAGKWTTETTLQWQARIADLHKWRVTTGNTARITGMLGRAQAHLTVLPEDMDQAPLLFNLANGTLDLGLKLPDVRRHDQADRITMVSPVRFDPHAAEPAVFLGFLETILPDEPIREFVQRWLGYCLSGKTDEQSLVLLFGAGANGKSTLVDLMAFIFGDYAATLNIKSLLRDDRSTGSQATPDLARLPGKRFVRTSEPEQGAQLSEGRVKEMTGGEPLTVRNLNEGFFEFVPAFKLIVSFNNKPSIRGTDDGIWRRLLLVPFKVQIPREKRDKTLLARMKAEAPAILNWLIDGWEKYRESGLQIPDEVRTATEEYRAESDQIGEFLAQAVEFDPAAEDVEGGKLYSHYAAWCKAMGYEPMKGTAFGRRLKARSSVRWAKVGTIRYFGMKLKPLPAEGAA